MIGLIFGETDFPIKILEKIKKKRLNYLIIDLSKSKKFKKDRNSYSISIGQFGKIIKILKDNNCKKVLFGGKVTKPNFSKLKLDLKGIYYMPRILKAFKIGDAAILKELIKILLEHKIKVIKLNFFNPELTLSKGTYTKIKPDRFEKLDIKNGIDFLNKLNAHNHTQAIVLRKSKVIAQETSKGTQRMLQGVKKNKISQGMLIKFPKKKQDLRVDLPTIGLETLRDCKRSGIKGIVLKSMKNIILDRNKCITFANNNKMFISVK